MTAIMHHIPAALLTAYATGSLPQPFALVVASHISLCAECRAGLCGPLPTGITRLSFVPNGDKPCG